MTSSTSPATVPATKGHPWFAASYDLITRLSERRVLAPLRRRLLSAATGKVLEIGAGTGANFPYYSAAEAVVAIEPDPFMLRRSRKRAYELGLQFDLHQSPAEALPFGDASFDTVVSTLVLCTVTDPTRALAEIKRVLKPDGTLRFVEHVRAGGFVGRLQDHLTPVWRLVGAGCHPNRRTVERIWEAGFDIVEMERQRLPFLPLVVGVARPWDRTMSDATQTTGRTSEPSVGP